MKEKIRVNTCEWRRQVGLEQPATAASGFEVGSGKWVSLAWVSGSKINWSSWVSLSQASWRHGVGVGVGGSVTGWVSLSRLPISDLFVSPLSSQVSLSFLFFSFSFILLLSPFGLVLDNWELRFVFFLKIYMGHGLVGWWAGVHIFGSGAWAKTKGGPSSFLSFFWENFSY